MGYEDEPITVNEIVIPSKTRSMRSASRFQKLTRKTLAFSSVFC